MLLFPGFLVLLTAFTVDCVFREARDEEFPFQVSIRDASKKHICGGVIIAPKWVVTSSSCMKDQKNVTVFYGSADASKPFMSVEGEQVAHEPEYLPGLKGRLAMLELKYAIENSIVANQASLPMCTAQLKNFTKLSGWRVEQGSNVGPTLYVADYYFVMTESCKVTGGATLKLEPDQFCGMDEEEQNKLYNPGAVVSKRSIILGMLTDIPDFGMPHIFTKMSNHEQWIKGVLGTEASYIHWVDKVPGDSAPSHRVISLALWGISTTLLWLI